MKKYLFIVLLVGVGFGQDNPCEDPKYLEIKVKSYNEVSESEYQYFLKIRKECKSFRDKERKQEKKRKAQSTKRKFANESQWIDEQSKIIKNKKDYPNNDLWKSNKSNDNPCEDTKYMSLRNRALKEELKKPLTHMTNNEFRLFMLKDDECSEYKRKQKKVYEDSVKKAEKNSQKSKYTSKRKREKPKSKNNQSSKFWLDVGMEVLNLSLIHI